MFETATVAYLNLRGITAERRALHGNTDRGDIAGVEDWTFELKNRKSLDVGGAIDEARLEATNAKTRWYAAIVKRPRKGSPADAIAAMPFSLLVDLVQELRRLNGATTSQG